MFDILTNIVKEKGISHIINNYKQCIETHLKYQNVIQEFKNNINIIHKFDHYNNEYVTLIFFIKKYKYINIIDHNLSESFRYNTIRYSYHNDEDRLRISLHEDHQQNIEINCCLFNHILDDLYGFDICDTYYTTIQENSKFSLDEHNDEIIDYIKLHREYEEFCDYMY